jgi:hypothetical protein
MSEVTGDAVTSGTWHSWLLDALESALVQN